MDADTAADAGVVETRLQLFYRFIIIYHFLSCSAFPLALSSNWPHKTAEAEAWLFPAVPAGAGRLQLSPRCRFLSITH